MPVHFYILYSMSIQSSLMGIDGDSVGSGSELNTYNI